MSAESEWRETTVSGCQGPSVYGRNLGTSAQGSQVCHVRRSPLDALEVETSLAAGEPALQALSPLGRDHAGPLAAHAAEPGLCKRRRPLGWAALPRDVAQRGPGQGGPAGPRAEGRLLPREQQRRGRASWSSCGTCTVARTGARGPGAPGRCPRDAQGTLPERCSASCRQAWRML